MPQFTVPGVGRTRSQKRSRHRSCHHRGYWGGRWQPRPLRALGSTHAVRRSHCWRRRGVLLYAHRACATLAEARLNPGVQCGPLGCSALTTGPTSSKDSAMISPVVETPHQSEMSGASWCWAPLPKSRAGGGTAQHLSGHKAKGNPGITPAHASCSSWNSSHMAWAVCWGGSIIIRAGPLFCLQLWQVGLLPEDRCPCPQR